eukprot:105094-Prymnesium_polylepis.1
MDSCSADEEMEGCALLRLPAELTASVLGLLAASDLVRLGSTCYALKDAVALADETWDTLTG